MKRDPAANEGTPDLGDQYKDERTEKKIHEHLNNEKDVITEQDIANAPVGPVSKDADMAAAEETSVSQDLPAPASEETGKIKDDKVKDNTDPGIQTSWNVLGS